MINFEQYKLQPSLESESVKSEEQTQLESAQDNLQQNIAETELLLSNIELPATGSPKSDELTKNLARLEELLSEGGVMQILMSDVPGNVLREAAGLKLSDKVVVGYREFEQWFIDMTLKGA